LRIISVTGYAKASGILARVGWLDRRRFNASVERHPVRGGAQREEAAADRPGGIRVRIPNGPAPLGNRPGTVGREGAADALRIDTRPADCRGSLACDFSTSSLNVGRFLCSFKRRGMPNHFIRWHRATLHRINNTQRGVRQGGKTWLAIPSTVSI
jgi:hypothetical protein